jgi:hypothetical protein
MATRRIRSLQMLVIPRTLTAMTDTQTRIADRVRGVAAECRFTQTRIATTLQMSRTSVVERMNARVAWTAPELFVLSEAMGQPISRFFPEPQAVAA